MANPNFVPSFSSDEIWRGQDTNRCISDDLDTIEADIDKLQSDVGNLGGDYAPANHKHEAVDVNGLDVAIENKVSESLGNVRNFDTGTLTTGTNTAYTAEVPGITKLERGLSFIMIPHVGNGSQRPTLNVNNLGNKTLRQRLSDSSGNSQVLGDYCLVANKPVRVIFDGIYWIVDMPITNMTKVAEVVQMLAAKCDLNTEEKAMVSSFVDEFSLAE